MPKTLSRPGTKKVADGAYLLIRAAQDLHQDKRLEALEEIRALPGVKWAAPVTGLYHCVAKVEASTALLYLVYKIMGKSWVERVHVLHIDWPAGMPAELARTWAGRPSRQRQFYKSRRPGERPPPAVGPRKGWRNGRKESWTAKGGEKWEWQ